MSEPQNKVADLIKSQTRALKTFRKNQEALVEDVAKRVDKLEGKRQFAVMELVGLSQMLDAMADGLRIATDRLPVEQARARNELS